MFISFNPFINSAEVPKQKPVFHKKIDLMKLNHGNKTFSTDFSDDGLDAVLLSIANAETAAEFQ